MKRVKRYLAALAAGALLTSGCFSSGSVQTEEGPETTKTTETLEMGTNAGSTEVDVGATETIVALTETDKAAESEERPEGTEGTSLYERGLAMIQRMDAMAGSDAYSGMMSSSSEVLDILDAISAGDYTKPFDLPF